jgi:dTDP-4-dehydrorhamnose 3,5-epimerase
MIFTPTKLPGAYVIGLDRREDPRGFFARTWCEEEFREHGLETRIVQCNMSFNEKAGTLRGMHYQAPPYAEVKLVRCIRGAIVDVIIDLRIESETYKQWIAVELTADNGDQLYVPEGFAHGFQTLVPDTDVAYVVSEAYAPGMERGLRWDDPEFAIEWPEAAERTISDKDAAWADFDESMAVSGVELGVAAR